MLELVQAQGFHIVLPLVPQSLLHTPEAFLEFPVTPAQGLLSIHIQQSRHIDRCEQQVTDFIFDGILVVACNSFLDLRQFFLHLVHGATGILPVETHPRRTFLQLVCPHQCRQCPGNAFEHMVPPTLLCPFT